MSNPLRRKEGDCHGLRQQVGEEGVSFAASAFYAAPQGAVRCACVGSGSPDAVARPSPEPGIKKKRRSSILLTAMN